MRYSSLNRALAAVLLMAGIGPAAAWADLAFWTQTTGNWNVNTNWTTGVVPGNEGTSPKVGAIDNLGTAEINSVVPTVDEVWVGDSGGQGTLNVVAGGALTVTNATQAAFLVVGRTADQFGEHSGSRLNVSGGNVLADRIEIGQVFNNFKSTDAQMIISGNGVVTVRNYMRVGHGDSGTTFGAEGSVTVRDNGQFIHDGSGTLPFIDDFIAFGFNGGSGMVADNTGGNTGTLNLEDNAIFSSKRPVRFGWVEEAHGFLNISDNAQLIIDSGELSAAAIMFGDFNNSLIGTGQDRPTGIANQTGGTVTVGTDAARPRWTAIGGSGYGEYNISGGKLNIYVRDGLNVGDTTQGPASAPTQNAGEGVINLSGTGVINATELWFGKIGRATGTMNQTGGTVNVGKATADGNFVDRIDTLGEQTTLDPNLDGALTLGAGFGAAATSTGIYNISGGTLNARHINVGWLGNGTLNQSGNSTVIADTGIIVAWGTNDIGVPSTGIMNLNGGVMETAAIGGGGGGNSTVNFNGTTVRAIADQPDFIVNLTTANVQSGGLIVDSNGFNVSSNANFTGSGGHIKRGAGTSAMTGNLSYAGTTTVEEGTLLVNGMHTGGGTYTVNAGATLGGSGTIGANVVVNGALAPGTSIGNLTVNGNVSFGTNGIFDVEIDAAGHVSDLLVVNGNLDLSGLSDMLRLTLVDGVLPEVGPLTIATYTGTLTGTFNLDNANFTIDYGSGTNDAIRISNITSIDSSVIPGDYNGDGRVDGGDYVRWRNNLGDPTEADINNAGDGGDVSISDYAFWKARYGNPGSGGGGISQVPEPAAWGLTLIGFAAMAICRRRCST